ncbi:actin-like ATPase domain-containing protein [Zopfia rhizophila CBS 207.26]|uniref:Actin-like ATPase domain-containing protein n=1 Tax=Zopfia rhizophila CBS 207.26 TaxID=1314779 RepID=A0A6A6EBW0_9PEZI|nr:actin-like ATPase domain-containing protein [Zopfia rhizophila CBS 207.26]
MSDNFITQEESIVSPVELGEYLREERRAEQEDYVAQSIHLETEDGSIQERRLVIGLDYGTTYTGIALATPFADVCDIDEIDVLSNWGPQMGNHDKIPSAISYSKPSEAMEQQWGSSLSPGAVAMVHTKLELDVQDVSEELDFILQALDGMKNLHFQHIKASGPLPDYTDESAEKIVTDYLTKVFIYLHHVLGDFTRELTDIISTDIVVTVPTEWGYRARNSTYRALTEAGFNKNSFPNLSDVIFVTEPEAAAIYTARYLKEKEATEFLKERECFILCDAGGGTVDVVSYRVIKLQPSLKLQKIGDPTGKKCGSIFIDMEFKKWLRSLIGDKNYQKLDPNTEANKISSHATEGEAMRILMKRFDALKKQFHSGSEDRHVDLPKPLHNLTIPGKVNSGEITITCYQMSKFFDVCIEQIVELIEQHMYLIGKQRFRLKNLFLIGGFGASEYLQEIIKERLDLSGINLRKPDTSWTAVVRGAVICGIEKSITRDLIRTTFCRHNYGICVSEIFSEIKHERQDLKTDSMRQIVAEGQLLWLLNKGDVILSTEATKGEHDITVSFTKTELRQGTITIYMYSDDDRPSRIQDSKEELIDAYVLTWDLTGVPLTEFEVRKGVDKQPIYFAVLKLKMSVWRENVEASIVWKNEIALCTASNIMYP